MRRAARRRERAGLFSLFQDWPPQAHDHAAPFQRFRSLPLSDLIPGLDVVFDFHRFAAELGWVAVDFYDGAMIYDFTMQTLRLIDLDNYRDRPFTNEMGRMFGSTRFMAPEEFELGAIIDEVTTVFTMGRVISVFFVGRDFGTHSLSWR